MEYLVHVLVAVAMLAVVYFAMKVKKRHDAAIKSGGSSGGTKEGTR